MKEVTLLYSNKYYMAGIGEKIELFTLDEVKNYPNISKSEFDACKFMHDTDNYDKSDCKTIIGFVKGANYTDECPEFVQVYKFQIEEEI